MAHSRERIILGSVLSIGLLALAVDRVLLGGGTSGVAGAQAAVAVEPYTVSGDTNAAAADGRPDHDAARLLHDRFEHFAALHELDLENATDAFGPSQAWAMRDDAASAEPTSAIRRADFRRRHRLYAVMLGGDEARVVVNDQIIRVGEEIDGYRLLSIGERTALFVSGVEQVRLELDAD